MARMQWDGGREEEEEEEEEEEKEEKKREKKKERREGDGDGGMQRREGSITMANQRDAASGGAPSPVGCVLLCVLLWLCELLLAAAGCCSETDVVFFLSLFSLLRGRSAEVDFRSPAATGSLCKGADPPYPVLLHTHSLIERISPRPYE